MMRGFGIIVLIVLASTMIGVLSAYLPPQTARIVPFLLPLIGFIELGWLIYAKGGEHSD
jgi:hypothetical protein